MSDLNKKVHEIDVDGCHVTVECVGKNEFISSVSYKSYNTKGVHVASPQWDNLGNEEETKDFIRREVGRASNYNKPTK